MCIKSPDFVESLLRKYSGDNSFYLNDSHRILVHSLKPVQTIIVTKMLGQIWNIRCKIAFSNYSSDKDNDVNVQVETDYETFSSLGEKLDEDRKFQTTL